jgi:chaperonin GroEL (HSP60 family)
MPGRSSFARALLHAPPALPTANRPQEPKACSVVLRGASKDILNEVERNLHDAMGVARNVCIGGCLDGCVAVWP